MADAHRKIMLAIMLGALFAAAVLAINVRELRSDLRATQAALARAVATAEVAQHEAAMCRGMIGGQADPVWQIQVRF